MPVLEICHLRIKPHLSPITTTTTTTTSPSSIPLAALQKARQELRSRVFNTHSRFYQCVADPASIYIFGAWPDVARHEAFLASSEKGEILDAQEDVFAFGWVGHFGLGLGRGLGAEGVVSEDEETSMQLLPLKAPVVCLARYVVTAEMKRDSKWADIKSSLQEITSPFPVLAEWRLDPEGGMDEFAVVSGWEGVEACDGFWESLPGEMRGEVRVLRDMEGGS